MNARHILAGSMICLLFSFANCDTMDDVKKMEKETDDLTLVYVAAGGGGKVCHPGALILNPGGSRTVSNATSGSTQWFIINISTPGLSLTVKSTGSAGLTGQLNDSNCAEISTNGNGTGTFSITAPISIAGNYWLMVVVGSTGPYTVSATYP